MILKFIWKQKTWDSQKYFKKKNKVGEFILPDLNTSYKPTGAKTRVVLGKE